VAFQSSLGAVQSCLRIPGCPSLLIRDAQLAIDAANTVFAPPLEFLQRACEIGSRRRAEGYPPSTACIV
jgi:hypothetical protein